jgi:hypothetical protein
MAKFNVIIVMDVTTKVNIEAEDEMDADHKIVASGKDWIQIAAEDPDAHIDSLELQICEEHVFDDVSDVEEAMQAAPQ